MDNSISSTSCVNSTLYSAIICDNGIVPVSVTSSEIKIPNGLAAIAAIIMTTINITTTTATAPPDAIAVEIALTALATACATLTATLVATRTADFAIFALLCAASFDNFAVCFAVCFATCFCVLTVAL